MQLWIKRTVQLSLILLFTLLFLELATRILMPQIAISPVLGKLDPILGYTLKPNVTAIHKTTEFNTLVHINSRGYRSSELDYLRNTGTQNGTKRILFLGDSMTYGWGVNAEERYTDILAEELGFELLNAGIPGYKMSNIDAYYETEGYKYNADIVVLAYNLRTGAANINSAEYGVENGTLVKKPLYVLTLKNKIKKIVAQSSLYSYFSQHSYLFSLFRNAVVSFLNVQAPAQMNCSSIEETWYTTTKEREVLTVQDLNSMVTRENKTFVVVVLPLSYCHFDSLLTDFMNSTNLPHQYYLGPAFAAANTTEYYYPLDGHWNALGHSIAAQGLLAYFQTLFSEENLETQSI